MLSINTNAGAYAALQSLNATNKQLQIVQNKLNTGLEIAGPKDNGAVYAIAQNQRAEVAGLNAVRQSLSRGVSVADVSIAAGQAISDILIEMKEKTVAARDASLDTASRTALDADFSALRDQITTIVNNAEFNGINLLTGTNSLQVLANDDGSLITVNAQNMQVSSGLALTAGLGLTSVANASAALSAVAAAITDVSAKLSDLGTGAKSLEIHDTFVSKLQDALKIGIGNLVDADLAAESANLQSLQIKQQLGIQALSIANSAPQTILALFR